jgi:hypothetical protein
MAGNVIVCSTISIGIPKNSVVRFSHESHKNITVR